MSFQKKLVKAELIEKGKNDFNEKTCIHQSTIGHRAHTNNRIADSSVFRCESLTNCIFNWCFLDSLLLLPRKTKPTQFTPLVCDQTSNKLNSYFIASDSN